MFTQRIQGRLNLGNIRKPFSASSSRSRNGLMGTDDQDPTGYLPTGILECS